MRKRWVAAVSHSQLTTVLTTTMTTVGLPDTHLHGKRTRVVPDRIVGLCLRIRRLGAGGWQLFLARR